MSFDLNVECVYLHESTHFAHSATSSDTRDVQDELEQYRDVGDGDEAVQQHQAVDEGVAAAGEVPAEVGEDSFKQTFAKVSQSWRRPLLGPSPGN